MEMKAVKFRKDGFYGQPFEMGARKALGYRPEQVTNTPDPQPFRPFGGTEVLPRCEDLCKRRRSGCRQDKGKFGKRDPLFNLAA